MYFAAAICCFAFLYRKREENIDLDNYSFSFFFSDWKGIFTRLEMLKFLNGGQKNSPKIAMKTWIRTLKDWRARNGRETIKVWETQLKQGKALLETVELIKPDFLSQWLDSLLNKSGTLIKAFPAFKKLSTSFCLVNSQVSHKEWVLKAPSALELLTELTLSNF